MSKRNDQDFKLYRFWLRYATERFELRAGLQKINFGSASVIRPLMWFDKMDTRDPLMLTNGVYALLARYYFPKNSNLWLWFLYGNNKPKGWEFFDYTKRNTPEFGGRFQVPIPGGEAALSFHSRKTYLDVLSYPHSFPENKIGFDAKVDVGIGLWVETVIKHTDYGELALNSWVSMLNLGMDYTFSVVMANYPVSIMNNIMAMVYYNWDSKDTYRFVSFQRKYDYLTYNLIGFWNPELTGFPGFSSSRNLFGGKGIQFMVVLNI